jgi:hypothetical protein
LCNDLPSPSDWAVGSLAVGPKTKTIPNREVISGLIPDRFGFVFEMQVQAGWIFQMACNDV